jgi:hypothetical protein
MMRSLTAMPGHVLRLHRDRLEPATLLRYELVRKDVRTPGTPLLAHDIALDPKAA